VRDCRSWLVVAAVLTSASCATPQAPASNSRCFASGSSNWQAWVNAMPGPGARPKLIVTGRVETPTGGNRATFAPYLQVGERDPVQVTVTLEIKALSDIATQAVTPHDVRGEWPMSQPVGSVIVRCQGETLAVISPVETVH